MAVAVELPAAQRLGVTSMPFGSRIIQESSPVGWAAPAVALPVMVVVRVIGLLTEGVGEAAKEITGAVAASVAVTWLLVALA